MDGLRHQLLPGSGLAEDEDSCPRGGGLLHDLEDGLQLRGVADDLREPIALSNPCPEVCGFEHEAPLLQRLLEDHHHCRKVQRLDQIALRALPHGLNRRVDRAEGGHHHEHCIRAELASPLEHGDAIELGHSHIGQDAGGGEGCDLRETILPVSGLGDLVALHLQEGSQARAGIGLLVDDQNSLGSHEGKK